jgi:hypothetical protein
MLSVNFKIIYFYKHKLQGQRMFFHFAKKVVFEMLFCEISLFEMSLCEISLFEMSLCEISLFEMLFCEISLFEISLSFLFSVYCSFGLKHQKKIFSSQKSFICRLDLLLSFLNRIFLF